MRIIHIIFSKGFAGTERYLCNLANYQSSDNSVCIIKINTSNNLLFKKNIIKNVKIFNINNFFKKLQIKKIIREISPDIIHTHLGGASKIVDKRWGKFKLITTMHMNYNHEYFKNHDAIICSNNHQKKEIRKLFKGKLYRTNLWPINEFKIQKKESLKKILKIPKNFYVFGSVGRFHKQKGFDFLAEAFNELNLLNVKLVLIGNGHETLVEKYKHNKNIILLGHQNDTKKFYKIFNAAIFPSRWESFGLSLIEAMAHKLPIISTVHEGNRDWIKNHKILTIGIDNTKHLKKALIKYSKTKPKKKKYNMNDFKYENICYQIEKAYLTA